MISLPEWAVESLNRVFSDEAAKPSDLIAHLSRPINRSPDNVRAMLVFYLFRKFSEMYQDAWARVAQDDEALSGWEQTMLESSIRVGDVWRGLEELEITDTRGFPPRPAQFIKLCGNIHEQGLLDGRIRTQEQVLRFITCRLNGDSSPDLLSQLSPATQKIISALNLSELDVATVAIDNPQELSQAVSRVWDIIRNRLNSGCRLRDFDIEGHALRLPKPKANMDLAHHHLKEIRARMNTTA